MAITHAESGRPVDVAPLGTRLASHRTQALFKSTDLEVIRLVLPCGKSLPPHQVAGEITIQCLEGRIRVNADGAPSEIHAGELLFLLGGVQHDLVALEDATALVTIALKVHSRQAET